MGRCFIHVQISGKHTQRWISLPEISHIFVQYSVTKKIFSKDKRNDSEKKVMRLANRAILSTAEIIKCIDQNMLSFATDEDLLDVLYHDEYTTSDNIAYAVRSLPQCRPVITSIANLYLRKQIIFERS